MSTPTFGCAPLHQRGIATLLMLIFLGVALSVAVLSALRMVNTTQDQSLAFHSATQAQTKAWTGVEILEQYLVSLVDNDEIAGFLTAMAANNPSEANPAAVSLAGVNDLSINIVGFNDADPATNKLTANISGSAATNTKAGSTSILQVVYEISTDGEGGSTGGEELPAVITFNRNLRLGGDIVVRHPANEQYVINVNGDLNTNGNSITGVNAINATGNIQIGSGSDFDRLHSNGDVQLTGSVTGDFISARGNICLTGAVTFSGTSKANGTFWATGSAGSQDVYTIGQSDNVGTQLCAAPAYSALAVDSNNLVYGVDLRGNSRVPGSVTSSASVKLNSGFIGTLTAEGNLAITNSGGDIQNPSQIGGTFTDVQNPKDPQVTVVGNLSVPLTPVDEVVVEVDRFDANLYRDQANYAFYYESSRRKVTVSNVTGIPNGEYFIGDPNFHWSYSGPRKDMLCTDATCSTPPYYPICKGQSDYNGCFTYQTWNQSWNVSGLSMSPGVVFFDNNVTLGNGTYYNTFISAGSISTSGNHKTYAVNYAGYDGSEAGAPKGICTNAIYPYPPAQLCSGGSYNDSHVIGNYAYMAGSVIPNTSTYQGGNVTTGASSYVYGSILAGNQYISGGTTEIHGFITAQAHGAATNNSLDASTTIVVENLPTTYEPQGTTTVAAQEGGTTYAAKVLWVRPL